MPKNLYLTALCISHRTYREQNAFCCRRGAVPPTTRKEPHMPDTSSDLATPANLPVPLGFAPPSLTRDEDASPYETLRARAAEAVRPGNFIEEILVRGVLEHVWE